MSTGGKMRKYKKEIKNIGEIPDTENGDLLLMAISRITGTVDTSKTPNEVLEFLQKLRFDIMYKEKS